MFIVALFIIAKIWTQSNCPAIEERTQNMRGVCVCVCVCVCVYTHTNIYAYTHNGVLVNYKKNEILPYAATWMIPETITLSEICQREKYYMISLTCRI